MRPSLQGSREQILIEQMRKEAKAWNRRRNKEVRKLNWRFTTADARINLKRLYPHFE
ncbi:MAG: hypothetical protein LBK62_07090 [Treponema sp.]|nr:hypothetical protein [Treponema sp.]